MPSGSELRKPKVQMIVTSEKQRKAIEAYQKSEQERADFKEFINQEGGQIAVIHQLVLESKDVKQKFDDYCKKKAERAKKKSENKQ